MILLYKNKMIDIIRDSALIEVFQHETRLKFKPSKCKLLVMNGKEEISDSIGKVNLEKVAAYVYLGTIVSINDKRNEEITSKIAAARAVSNEIVLIMKSVELSIVRFSFVDVLMNACLDMKLKYGSGVWNKLNVGQSK